MQADLLVTNIGQLLTLAGPNAPRTGNLMSELGIINNAAMAVKDGLVAACGPKEQILKDWDAPKSIDVAGATVMPGFVDAHTHPVFVHTRQNEFEMRIMGKSYVEISQSGGGIRSSINYVRQADADTLFELAHKRLSRLIGLGTTTVEAKSGYGLTTVTELTQLDVIARLQKELPIDIVPTFMGAHEFPEEYKTNHGAYIDILVNEMLPACQGKAEFCDIFTEAHVYNIEESRKVLSAAKKLGYKLKMHADEIEPMGGAELAAELGAVSADHLGAASDAGIKAMAAAGVIAVLLPGTIFSLGTHTYARAKDMITAGVPVALATDYNPGSCNCDSMQIINTLACLEMRMTPAEAVVASTINAAWAIGRGQTCGSLEAGKNADFLVLDTDDYRFMPYHFGSNNVKQVYKKGVCLATN